MFFATDNEESLIRAVWLKGREVYGRNPSEWRYDDLGNLIKYDSYGDRHCAFGWEKDHYPVPKSMGGRDTLDNLPPLHWRANVGLGGLLRS